MTVSDDASSSSAAAFARDLGRHLRDGRVTAALAAVPRELFVPEALRDRAWRNEALPIGGGQTISQPLLVAGMCEVLGLRGDEHVLDVGTGSGWHAALLSRLAAHVWSIERRPELSAAAARALATAGIENVTLLVGDGGRGHPVAGPYDAINVAAAAPRGALATLETQLAAGGRLLAPVGGSDGQRLELVRRTPEGLERVTGPAVRFVPLI